MRGKFCFILMALLCIIMLVGCSTSTQADPTQTDVTQMDANALLDEAVKSLQNIDSLSIEHSISMDVKDNENNQQMSIEGKLNMDNVVNPEISSKSIMELSFSQNGEAQKGTVTIYVVEEDGELVSYVQNEDGWVDQGNYKVESEKESTEFREEAQRYLGDDIEREAYADPKIVGIQKSEDGEVLVLECTLDFSEATDFIDTDMLGLEESQESIVKSLLSSVEVIPVTMHLDIQKYDLVMIEIDVGEGLNEAITQLFNIAAAAGSSDYDISVNYILKLQNFNSIDSIVVPEELKNSVEASLQSS